MTTTKTTTARRAQRPPPDPLTARASSRDEDAASGTLFYVEYEGDNKPAEFINLALNAISAPETQAPSLTPRPSVAPTRHRERAHRDALETAERTGVSTNSGKQRVIDEVSCWLDIYIRCLGVGARFQAADFHNWLIDINREPPAEHFTPQALGALFLARVRERLLRNTGIYQADAPKRHSSSKRPVWEILDIRGLAPREMHEHLDGAAWTAPTPPTSHGVNA